MQIVMKYGTRNPQGLSRLVQGLIYLFFSLQLASLLRSNQKLGNLHLSAVFDRSSVIHSYLFFVYGGCLLQPKLAAAVTGDTVNVGCYDFDYQITQ